MSNEQSNPRPRVWLKVTAVTLAALLIAAICMLIWFDGDARESQLAALVDSGQHAQALELANELLRAAPEDDDVLRAKCRALEALQREHEAVGTYSLLQSPTVVDLQNWANLLMRLGQWQRAAETLTKARQQVPSDGEITFQLTTCWLQLKRPESAIDTAKQLLSISGYRGRAHLQLAAAYRQLGVLEEVSRHLEQALLVQGEQLPLSHREICLSAAETLLTTGRARHALKILQPCPTAEADSQLPLLRGDAHLQLGDYGAAETEYRKVLAMDSAQRVALESLAETKLQQKLPAAAVELLLPLAESPGTTSSTAWLLQRAYTDLRQFSDAQHWQERVEELRRAEQAASDRR